MDSMALVTPVACPKFVPLIEGEKFGSEEINAAVAEYTNELKAAGVDTLILSCTHYPFIKKEIEKALGENIMVIDPAEDTARSAIKILTENGLAKKNGKGNTTICFTADIDRGTRLVKYILPNVKSAFEQVDLQ